MNKIKSTRIEKGVTAKHIAKELDMSLMEYLFYEKMVHLIPASKGYRLCQLLNLDFNNL